MGLISTLRLALGGAPPRPWPVPRPPLLIVVTPNVRVAEWWLRDEGIGHCGLSRIRLVTPDRADRLRGLGGPLDIVVLHGPPWPVGKLEQIMSYVGIIAWKRPDVTVRDVWV